MLRVNAERHVARQRPRCRRPSDEGHPGLLSQREVDHDRGVLDVLVVLRGLEVGQGGAAARGVGHDPEALVDEALVPELAEDPPDRLHEGGVEGLVVVLEVDPPAQAGHRLLPLGGVPVGKIDVERTRLR